MLCLIHQAPILSRWRLRERPSSFTACLGKYFVPSLLLFLSLFRQLSSVLIPLWRPRPLLRIKGRIWLVHLQAFYPELVPHLSLLHRATNPPCALQFAPIVRVKINNNTPGSLTRRQGPPLYLLASHFLALNGVFFLVSLVFTRTGSCRMGIRRPYDEYPRAG